METFCKICGKYFSNLRSLQIHITRQEKITSEEYYEKFFPRRDYYSFEQIKFKDYNQYFNTYFVNRDNMAKWFSQNSSSEEAKKLALNLLNLRIKEKKLKYIPCEVELRSSMTPSILALEKIFNLSYDNVNFDGLIKRFDYSSGLKNLNLKNPEILIDTREQIPLKFNGYKTKVTKLDTGDYSISEPYYDDVFIERKSIDDFFSTFGVQNSCQRFERELNRAEDYGFYIVVMIEKDINECMNYFSSFSSNKFLSKYAFHNIKEIMQKYNNCQFVFCKNREHLESLALVFLENGQNSTKVDLQYLVDKRII